MIKLKASFLLAASVAMYNASGVHCSGPMKRFKFEPTVCPAQSKTWHGRRLLPASEYQRSPWVSQIENVLNRNIEQLVRAAEGDFSNQTYSCALDQSGKLTGFVATSEQSKNEKDLLFLRHSLENCQFAAPDKGRVKIFIHLYDSHKFGIDQEFEQVAP